MLNDRENRKVPLGVMTLFSDWWNWLPQCSITSISFLCPYIHYLMLANQCQLKLNVNWISKTLAGNLIVPLYLQYSFLGLLIYSSLRYMTAIHHILWNIYNWTWFSFRDTLKISLLHWIKRIESSSHFISYFIFLSFLYSFRLPASEHYSEGSPVLLNFSKRGYVQRRGAFRFRIDNLIIDSLCYCISLSV